MDMLLKIVKVEFFIVVEINSKYCLIKIKEIKIQQLYLSNYFSFHFIFISFLNVSVHEINI